MVTATQSASTVAFAGACGAKPVIRMPVLMMAMPRYWPGVSVSTNSAVASAISIGGVPRGRIVEVEATAFAAVPADAVVLDVREPAEFATGHLAGAVNIPRGVLEFQVDAHPALACAIDPALSRKALPLVLVCRSGGRAALAAASLRAMGFASVRSIGGGMLAWQEAGLPLV